MLIILSVIWLNTRVYAVNPHLFEISIRTSFNNIYLHKLIAEREVLTLGRECSMQEFPMQVEDWGCDSDLKGVICQKSYTCNISGGKKARYAHIAGIEELLAKEINATGYYQELSEVKYSSRNGSYFLKPIYNPPTNNPVEAPVEPKQIPPSEAMVSHDDIAKEEPTDESIPVEGTIAQVPPEDTPMESTADYFANETDSSPTDSSMQDYQLESAQAYEKTNHSRKKPYRSRGGVAEFDLSFSWITDNNNGNMRTTHYAWTPKYKFDSAFMIGLDFGAQVVESSYIEDDYFFAIDGALSGYIYITDKTYLKVFSGIQRWNGDLRGTHSLKGAGIGFALSETISRFFIQYVTVDNTTENEEIHVGFGLSL